MYFITIENQSKNVVQLLSRHWKIKEAITAYNIENIYTKSEIMELYLNSVFFGHRAYGVQQASKYYFGKDVKDLNLNECATLIGILPAPNAYSPKKNINTAIGYSFDFYNSGDVISNIFEDNICVNWESNCV